MNNRQDASQFDYRKLLDESAEDLYENATCGYLSYLPDGTIVKLNRTLLGWLGYKAEEVVQKKKFGELLTIGGKIFYETHLGPLLQMQRFVNEISLELLRPDRTLLPVLVNAVQLKDTNDQPVLNRITLVNITDRRKYEQELLLAKRKAEQVSQELAAANQELALANEEILAGNEEMLARNEELNGVNQRLVSLNNDLDNFIYAASHDLKAPILNIEGLLKVLVRHLPKEIVQQEQVNGILAFMQGSVERFKKTISDLTQVARAQKEVFEETEQVSIAEMLREVLADMALPIAESGASVETAVEECPPLHFSRKNLKSILYNLLSNAIKYRSPDRESRVLISCRLAGEYTELSVQDNGLGIPASGISKIFTMFKRLHSHVEGTGIGLYIVKKIIDNSKGKIEVESKEGKGSTFRVYFKR